MATRADRSSPQPYVHAYKQRPTRQWYRGKRGLRTMLSREKQGF